MDSNEIIESCRVLVDTPEGRELLKEMYCKHFPDLTHEAVCGIIDGNLSYEEFLTKLHNSVLDDYLETGDKDNFKFLGIGNIVKNEIT